MCPAATAERRDKQISAKGGGFLVPSHLPIYLKNQHESPSRGHARRHDKPPPLFLGQRPPTPSATDDGRRMAEGAISPARTHSGQPAQNYGQRAPSPPYRGVLRGNRRQGAQTKPGGGILSGRTGQIDVWISSFLIYFKQWDHITKGGRNFPHETPR